ncbi:AAA family ATPase [Shinella sp. CPCC 101442]|uniref:TrlF family AAA-like ATPase n=1 Tax=Shinella sp. CPCC 101442 TaxID=2932265 RepID=UPI0021528D5E|nr:AAA family ATPase [Shinella sp. CPCC 101442]MCR6502120.1 AAA family ATPase [Shinella sp. CPCC 101442]
MHQLGHHPGTVWQRSDLQMHTPRDGKWIGNEIESDDTAELLSMRSAWARKLIEHCLSAEPPVTAIAITDHHDYCIAEVVRLEAQGSGLTVYVGVEVTCSDNAQCLIVFDPATSTDIIGKVLAALPGVPPHADHHSRGPSIAHANLSVAQLAEMLEKNPLFQGQYLLLPHFGDGNAHKTLNVPSTGPRFAALTCEGVYVEKPYSDLESGTLEKLKGAVAEWGRRRRGVVVTGDNRNDNFERVAAHPCWLKLGEPTIEALRQALLADEARIAYALPREPSERIIALRVQSALTGEAPLDITFNAGFNALVGGRGTGKSAILEYLRFGLARTDADIPRADGGTENSRGDALISQTLIGGFVEIELEREGVAETWRRELTTRDFIQCTDKQGVITRLTLDAARERFRARAFRQKGLSSLTTDQANASDQVTGIAAAEALARRREVDRSIGNAKRTVATALQQLVSHWQATLEINQAAARVADLAQRVQSLNTLLAQGGVSDEHLHVIETAGIHARVNGFLETVSDALLSEQQDIPSSSRLEVTIPETISEVEFPHIHSLAKAVDKTKAEIAAAYDTARKSLEELRTALHVVRDQQDGLDVQLATRLLDANEAQTSHRTLIDDSKRLGIELGEAEQGLRRATARTQDTKAYEVAFRKAQLDIIELLNNRRQVLADAAGQVAGKSSGLLKARLGKDKAPTEYVSALRRLTEGAYISDAEQKCSDWVKAALAADELAWTKISAELLAIYSLKIAAGSPTEPGNDIVTRLRNVFFSGAGVTDRQAGRIYLNLSDSTLADVISAVPQDRIVMTYVDESGREMPFGQASPGQQASALLELLLRQSAGTLVIDQPEDDLDNRVIMKIVSLVRSSKSNRQLVFTTHNPNIVVNGDADKVIALKTREAQAGGKYDGPVVSLQVDGAIETAEIRKYITHLIEGGREAFDLRSRKYGYEAER